MLIYLVEAVGMLKHACGFRVKPSQQLDGISMALRKVLPVPDRLVMEHPVTELPESINSGAEHLSLPLTSRQLLKKCVIEKPGPQNLFMFIAGVTQTAPEAERQFCDDFVSIWPMYSSFSQSGENFGDGALFAIIEPEALEPGRGSKLVAKRLVHNVAENHLIQVQNWVQCFAQTQVPMVVSEGKITVTFTVDEVWPESLER